MPDRESSCGPHHIQPSRKTTCVAIVVVVVSLFTLVMACLSEFSSLGGSRIHVHGVHLSPGGQTAQHSVKVNAAAALDYPARLHFVNVQSGRCDLIVHDEARLAVILANPLSTTDLTEVNLHVDAPNVVATATSSWNSATTTCVAEGELYLLHAIRVSAHVDITISNETANVSVRVGGLTVWSASFGISLDFDLRVPPTNYRCVPRH